MTRGVLCLGLLVMLGGCAVAVRGGLSEAERAGLGRVGLVVAEFEPERSISGPTPLGGLGGGVLGATKGLTIGVLSGAGCFVTLAGVLVGVGASAEEVATCGVALMTPYWVGRGVVEGAMNAVPEGERRKARDAIARVLDGVGTRHLLSALLAEGRQRVPVEPLVLTVPGPTHSGDRPSYRSLGLREAETVVEVVLLRLAFQRGPAALSRFSTASVPDVDPPLDLVAEARVRVVRVADDTTLLERTCREGSGRRARFTEWGGLGAEGLGKELDAIMAGLARAMAFEVFGPPQPGPDAAPAEGKPAKEPERGDEPERGCGVPQAPRPNQALQPYYLSPPRSICWTS